MTADDKSKVYGSADPALTVTVPTGALESATASPAPRAGGRQGRRQLRDHEGQPDGRRQLRAHGHPRHADDHQEGGVGDRGDKSKVYGSADPALTTTDSGFLAADLGADKIAFSASRAAGESVASGPYAITPAASDGATSLLGNYDVTYNPGKLTITKKAASVTAGDKSKVYGSADPALTDDRQRVPGRRSRRRQDRLQRLARCRRVGRGGPTRSRRPPRTGRPACSATTTSPTTPAS